MPPNQTLNLKDAVLKREAVCHELFFCLALKAPRFRHLTFLNILLQAQVELSYLDWLEDHIHLVNSLPWEMCQSP